MIEDDGFVNNMAKTVQDTWVRGTTNNAMVDGPPVGAPVIQIAR